MSKWEMVRLGDICSLKSGNSLAEEIVLKDGEIPYIKVSDLSIENNETRITRSTRYAYRKDVGRQLFPVGTTIFPKRGGAIATNKKRLTTCEICADLNIMGVIPGSKILPEFLYFYFQGVDLGMLGSGSSVPQINNGDIAPLQISLPPLETQKHIAKTLDTAAELLAKRKQQMVEMDNLIKSVFYDMFGDPITNPQKWKLVRLGDIGELNSGGTPTRTNREYFLGDIDWYSAGELNERYLKGSKEKLTEEAISNSAAKVFKKGSMLIGMYDTAAFKLGILTDNSSSNQACANIDVKKNMANIEWLYDCAQIMREYFLKNRRGVRQKNLNLGMIRSFEIPLPPLILQNQFASIVTKIEEQKALVKKTIDETQYLFDSLMSKYFD
ncbi:restriction endonuclease subunit S [Desulfosporosinus sp. FKA]|uniref:restriction endonuclease subunit S n=1 Tax=Desulfosporosinus sp. FKA TaxID=1969834 RepID=UPI000B4A20F8|nr:restriction endonuclease subunit S [Desulfosporosinus sp. FKA]